MFRAISCRLAVRLAPCAVQKASLATAQESWYEKLNRWEEALEAYERKYHTSLGTPAHMDAALGRLRCACCRALHVPGLLVQEHDPSLHTATGACWRWRSGSG